MNNLSEFCFADLKAMRDYALECLAEKRTNENECLVIANMAELEMIKRIVAILENSNKNTLAENLSYNEPVKK